ncbi:MAG TPA: GtrA family protein [Pseudonocardiaceae bacterium]|nr:GtrA family protein [Pseudonocardiaceae bacterium]
MTLTEPSVATARPAAEPVNRSSRWPSWLPSRLLSIRFSIFTVGSVVSTLISQLVLTLMYWGGGHGAALASVAAFIAGAIPNFLINWRFTWGRRGRPALLAELLPYLAIVIGGGLAATALTTIADHFLTPLLTARGGRTIVLDVVYLASYALFFVLKFALLNKVFTRSRTAPRAQSPEQAAGGGSAPDSSARSAAASRP